MNEYDVKKELRNLPTKKLKEILKLTKNMGKNEQKVITAIRTLAHLIKEHLEIWQKEIAENDGYLNPYYLIQLQALNKRIKSLHEKYYYLPVNTTYRDQFLNELKNEQLKVKKGVKVVKDEEQRYLPHNDFIVNQYIVGLTFERLVNYYEITIQRMGLEKIFDEMIKHFDRYNKFFEREIIL